MDLRNEKFYFLYEYHFGCVPIYSFFFYLGRKVLAGCWGALHQQSAPMLRVGFVPMTPVSWQHITSLTAVRLIAWKGPRFRDCCTILVAERRLISSFKMDNKSILLPLVPRNCSTNVAVLCTVGLNHAHGSPVTLLWNLSSPLFHGRGPRKGAWFVSLIYLLFFKYKLLGM